MKIIKRNLSLLLIFVFSTFIFSPNPVLADTMAISLVCENNNQSQLDVVKCDLHIGISSNGNSKVFTEISLIPEYDESSLSYVRFEANEKWQTVKNDGSKVILTSKEGVSEPQSSLGTFIGSFFFRINKTTQNMGYSYVDVLIPSLTSLDGETLSNLKNLNSNSYIYFNAENQSKLNVIYLNNNEISPKFDPNTIVYSATVDSDKVILNFEKMAIDSKTSVVSGKEYSLEYGSNKIEVQVTSSNGENITTYVLNINRPDNRSTNNKLKTLKINGESIPLNADVYYYKVTLPYREEKSVIEYVPQDGKAKVLIEGDENLSVGENIYTLKVISENDLSYDYIINIVREAKILNADSSLKSLVINKYYLDFDKDTYNYVIKIGNEKSLQIDTITNSELSSVKIKGNENLKNGSIVEIVVTAENGDTSTYMLEIQISKEQTYLLYINILLLVIIASLIGYIVIDKVKQKKANI